jgi:ABC-type transport system involved in cytochrome bd biosynthesis fused ATPase/permease subunit
MISRESLLNAERDVMSAGALHGASTALMCTAVIGGAALLLELVGPWLAWGYVGVALVVGLALQVVASRATRALEREVEQVRRQHRSG